MSSVSMLRPTSHRCSTPLSRSVFGIECRLNQYIDAERPRAKQGPHDEKRGYIASKLLKTLAKMNPNSHREMMVRFGREDGERSVVFLYRPITPELASAHDRLGELLHYNVFRLNPYLMAKFGVPDGSGWTLGRIRTYLGDLVVQLDHVAEGTLLTHGGFAELLESAEAATDTG